MTTTIGHPPGSDQFTHAVGDWINFRVPQPEMEVDAVTRLLPSVESRPGNVRFAIDGHEVYLLGESRNPDGLLTTAEVHQRLFVASSDPVVQVSHVDIDCALGETGCEWSQSPAVPNQWQAVANDRRGCRCNLTATIVQGGVEVCCLPVTWEAELDEALKPVLLRYLGAAHDQIRFARFTLQDRRVKAVSFAAADRLDVELPDSVAAAVAACGLVWREVSALGDNAIAHAWLKMTS